MRALIRYLRGRPSGVLPPAPPSRAPTFPQTYMGRLRRASMAGRSECHWWEAQDEAQGQWWTGDNTDPKAFK